MNTIVFLFTSCSYILMAEPDHVIVKPIPNLSVDGHAAAFPFFYIEPKKYESVLRKFFPEEKGPINTIDPIGNSPVIIEKVTTPFSFY
jgi:hydroxyproline O-arabinosyltransferase